uniref:Ig-like domain-containing protein n=1 Tax=Anabas testudineus TaxID=64144 RepID=A0A7N6BHK9_ANATE
MICAYCLIKDFNDVGFSVCFVFIGFSSVSGPPERVLAYVGEDVILPCSFDIASNRDDPTVEWSKEDLQPNVIFLYRDGCETFEMKHPAYEYKTHLIMRELKNGKCSLRISNIQLSDAGTYQCMRIWKDGTQEVTKVELVVGMSCFIVISNLPNEGLNYDLNPHLNGLQSLFVLVIIIYCFH